jgi:hypothetical protein
MKIIASLLILFIFNASHSQVVERDWRKFDLNWNVSYVQNDCIEGNSRYFGQLVFQNHNPDEPGIKVVFEVYQSEADLSGVLFETRTFLKSVFFTKYPTVMDRFEFKKNIYLLKLSQDIFFRDQYYACLAEEIEKYIKK